MVVIALAVEHRPVVILFEVVVLSRALYVLLLIKDPEEALMLSVNSVLDNAVVLRIREHGLVKYRDIERL